MKKKFRLLKNEEFKKVINERRSVSTKEGVIYYKLNDKENARFGISVSSKIGNSVIRHKIKRQIDAIVYESDEIEKQKNIDYVIIVRDDYKKNDFLKNKKVIEKMFAEIKKRMERENEKKV